MKTTYYFVETSDYNCIIATDGKFGRVWHTDSHGIDAASESVDLYQVDGDGHLAVDKIVSDLKKAFSEIDGLYTMTEILDDFDDVFEFDPDDYENLIEIITVD